ncbi:hypothetical protein R5H30_12050 [Sulfitobacter sp. D35]|uniref:hypothetical protein n=1 Tax=Sulfitobacter sp. D35 TaxID=3083252 RepID=UPI00296FE761|nr:hypothetical protein [Sulfitobacter sp. D35]MDW4498718.1 hypothetical protein [Sulfitobacter sp. D35]
MDRQEFQAFLDAISDCFIAGDFAPWRDRIRLPFTMITRTGPVVLTTEDALRRNFELYIVACKALNLDQIYRQPVALELCEDGTIIGTYATDLLSRGKRATPRYTSSMLLVSDPGGWKMTSILNARGHHDWTGFEPEKETNQ